MLQMIRTSELPTREPNGWNEIAIVGDGGVAGLLISSVTKIAQPVDCRRIVESVLATNDAAKIAKLREAVSLVSAKDEFEKLLKQLGSGAHGKGQNPTEVNTSSPPSPSPNVGKSTDEASPIREPTPKKSPEAKLAHTPIEQPTSSTPRSVVAVLIVAACGLLWLLLKRRS